MKCLTVCLFSILSLVSTAIRAADVDQSTPKATAMSFAKALEAGDEAAAKQLSVGSEQDQQVLSAMLEFTRSVKTLRDAAVKKYGDKADEVTGGGMNVDTAKAMEDTQITEEGDTATVATTRPQPSSMRLKKVDGKWKVDLTETLKGAAGPDQNIGQFQGMLKGWSAALTETAGEITDGKYPAPADATQALQVKMMAALKSLSPTTAPATEATTQPIK